MGGGKRYDFHLFFVILSLIVRPESQFLSDSAMDIKSLQSKAACPTRRLRQQIVIIIGRLYASLHCRQALPLGYFTLESCTLLSFLTEKKKKRNSHMGDAKIFPHFQKNKICDQSIPSHLK